MAVLNGWEIGCTCTMYVRQTSAHWLLLHNNGLIGLIERVTSNGELLRVMKYNTVDSR